MKKFLIALLLLTGTFIYRATGQTTAILLMNFANDRPGSAGYRLVDIVVASGPGYVTNNSVYGTGAGAGTNLNGSWEALNFRFTQASATPAFVNTDFVVTYPVAGVSGGQVTNLTAGGCYAGVPAFNIAMTRVSPAPDANGTPAVIATIQYPNQSGSNGNLAVRNTTTQACASRESFWSNSNAANLGVRLYTQGNLIVLPIKITGFVATANVCTTFLNWKGSGGNSTEIFSIERSSDGNTWQSIGEVAASGYSNIMYNYNYTDTNAVPGINYYRLLQQNSNGKKEYSGIVAVKINCGTGKIMVRPTVTSNEVEVLLPRGYEKANVAVLNVSGQLQNAAQQNSGLYRRLQLGNLPSGMYMVQVANTDGTVTYFKIIRQ